MGNLTNDMARLVNDIKSDHTSREKLLKDLERFLLDLKRSVSGMRSQFRHTHDEIARMEREKRLQFIHQLEQAVLNLKQESYRTRQTIMTDLAGARGAWRSLYSRQ